MSTNESSIPGGVAIPYDYGTEDKSSGSNKLPMFNGDLETFTLWKTKMYSHIMGLDEELWDVLEDGVSDLVLDEEGVVVDRKKHCCSEEVVQETSQDHRHSCCCFASQGVL